MNQQNAINICINTFINPIEQFRSHVYQDSTGIWTIGYGTTYINGIAVTANTKSITLQQAEQYRDNTLNSLANRLNTLITSQLNDNQYASCLSLSYNIGIGNFQYSTLLVMINNNPNDSNIEDEWLKWDHAGGIVVQGLLNRRQQEVNMYFS